jgi:hypothetical protein
VLTELVTEVPFDCSAYGILHIPPSLAGYQICNGNAAASFLYMIKKGIQSFDDLIVDDVDNSVSSMLLYFPNATMSLFYKLFWQKVSRN